MKFLGIDYGTKRVGVATSDESGQLAFPKETIPNDKNIFLRLGKIITEENIRDVVIGESLDYSGAPNVVVQEVEVFIKEFSEKFKLPVNKEKEFLTTIEARRYKESDGNNVDSSAAALILQRYLDKINNKINKKA